MFHSDLEFFGISFILYFVQGWLLRWVINPRLNVLKPLFYFTVLKLIVLGLQILLNHPIMEQKYYCIEIQVTAMPTTCDKTWWESLIHINISFSSWEVLELTWLLLRDNVSALYIWVHVSCLYNTVRNYLNFIYI